MRKQTDDIIHMYLHLSNSGSLTLTRLEPLLVKEKTAFVGRFRLTIDIGYGPACVSSLMRGMVTRPFSRKERAFSL